MKHDETVGVLEALLSDDFLKKHPYPPGWGGGFSTRKDVSSEVAEVLQEYAAKCQNSASKPQKQSVDWLESVWEQEAQQRNARGNWVLECAKNPDELKLRVRKMKDELERKQQEREERKKREEEEAERQRIEAEKRREARRKREEERKKREEEEAERQRIEEEKQREARRKQAEERKRLKEAEAERQRLEEEQKREARRKRAEERKKQQEEEAALPEEEREARREARRQEQERLAEERKKREEEKAEKRRIAEQEAEARREAKRQELAAREAERKKREEEKAEKRRLAEEEAEARREAREAERRRQRAEEAARERREAEEAKRCELAQKRAEEAARRKQEAKMRYRLGWTNVFGFGIAGAMLYGFWSILRSLDAALVQTGVVWPWCWWHLKFIVGLGIIIDLILGLMALEFHPWARDVISEQQYKDVLEPRLYHFFCAYIVGVLGMFIYAVYHLFRALGFSFRLFGVGLHFAAEFSIVGLGAGFLWLFCHGLLWGRYQDG